MGDIDFANDFAEQLFEALDNLNIKCDEVVADCVARKQRLTDALIWDEEEIVQLQEDVAAELRIMQHFYEDLGEDCAQWYDGASKKFASDAVAFTPFIEAMGDHKYMLMTYARNEF